MGLKTLRVLLFPDVNRDGLWWIAQGLEKDIATQSRSLEHAMFDIVQAIQMRHQVAIVEKISDPMDVPRAPERFQILFETVAIPLDTCIRLVPDTDWRVHFQVTG